MSTLEDALKDVLKDGRDNALSLADAVCDKSEDDRFSANSEREVNDKVCKIDLDLHVKTETGKLNRDMNEKVALTLEEVHKLTEGSSEQMHRAMADMVMNVGETFGIRLIDFADEVAKLRLDVVRLSVNPGLPAEQALVPE